MACLVGDACAAVVVRGEGEEGLGGGHGFIYNHRKLRRIARGQLVVRQLSSNCVPVFSPNTAPTSALLLEKRYRKLASNVLSNIG